MLTNEVVLIVPSTVEGNVKAPEALMARIMADVKFCFAGLFGGYTIVKGVGGFVSDTHGLIEDEITLISTSCDNAMLIEGLPIVVEMARNIAAEMGQESVGVKVNGVLYFVMEDTNVIVPSRLAA